MLFMSLFVSSSQFNNPLITPKYFCVVIGALLLQCCTICRLQHSRIQIDLVTLLIILFAGYLFIHHIVLANIKVRSLLTLVCAFLLYCQFKYSKQNICKIFNTVIIVAITLQAILGISQYWGLVNSNSNIGILGSFDNPAGFAICLAISSPFTLPLIQAKQNWKKIIGYAVLVIITFAIFYSKSRTGLLAIGCVLGYIGWIEWTGQSYVIKRSLLLILGSALLGGMAYLFVTKKESSLGRLLIWQISTTQILEKNNMLLGNGADSFLMSYMPAQGCYFQNHPTDNRLLLADNVIHPFNEYLLVLIEYGIVGLFLLVLIVFLVIRANVRYISPYILSFASLLLCSFFSYPFRYAYVWLIVAYLLANLSVRSSIFITITLSRMRLVKGVLLILSGLGLFVCVQEIKKEIEWNQSFHLAMEGSKEWVSKYERLFSQWQSPFFLYNYAALLNRDQNFDKSNQILHLCEKYYNDYDVQMLFADNYYNLQCFNLAEQYYKNAANMIPSRVMPNYCLWKMYKFLGYEEKALQLAKVILMKKVKVNNLISYKIKDEVQQYLSNCR